MFGTDFKEIEDEVKEYRMLRNKDEYDNTKCLGAVKPMSLHEEKISIIVNRTMFVCNWIAAGLLVIGFCGSIIFIYERWM